MRKFLRNNIMEILVSIEDGIAFAASTSREGGRVVLGDCAEGLSAVGATLRENLSADRFAWYEDVLQKAANELQALGDAQDGAGRKRIGAAAGARLGTLAAGLRRESEILREIVFLPYKASMWDAMESVWEAASHDPACAVTVVPIPYFERADGTMRYEGNQFPPHVTVTSFRKYNLSVMLPDVAYIHNAYDDRNVVTSVHPDYYTPALKKHVGTLVYLPYYVSNGPSALSMAANTAASRADVIVAFSEADRLSYAKCTQKADIVPLGSPKIDRIIRMEREKPPLPEAWDKLRGKKLFFLNTSLNSLLQNNEHYFDKIEGIFAAFVARDDVGLLWRPHPLTRATLRSMRTHLQTRFETLETQIHEGRFGVLDDTPDMGSAIALSDAYLGDGISSLVYLYGLTGKPMFLINFQMPVTPADEELSELAASDFCWALSADGSTGSAWGFSANLNALYQFDLPSGQAQYLGSVPDERNSGDLYFGTAKAGDRLVLSPARARSWAIFDLTANRWEKQLIPAEYCPQDDRNPAFCLVFRTERYLIFVPRCATAFARYDIEAGTFSYHGDWYERLRPMISNTFWGLFWGGCLVGDSLFLTSIQGNFVVELHIETMRVTVHSVGSAQNRYFDIACDGDSFWLTKFQMPNVAGFQEGLVRWNKQKGTVAEYNDLPDCSVADYRMGGFWRILADSGAVFVFPFGGDKILRIDKDSGKIEAVETGFDFPLGKRKSPYYWLAEQGLFGRTAVYAQAEPIAQHKAVTILSHDNSLLILDTKTGQTENRKLNFTGTADLWHNRENAVPFYHYENAFQRVDWFVDGVRSGTIPAFSGEQANFQRSINANSNGTCGQKVHEYITAKISKA